MMLPKMISLLLAVLLLLLATTSVSFATRLGEWTDELPSSSNSGRELKRNNKAKANTRVPCSQAPLTDPCGVQPGKTVQCKYSTKFKEYECFSNTEKAAKVAGTPPCEDGTSLVKMSTWWWMCK
ncbi:hypothetical protein IV203_010954 [Nitzschia inconspicua]|uniref:Uncharacterized protein n=1 Tax=Nitzschia inconspicua TaxID=303405 RepID=A0A9K3KY91_9STRA|nr:hypothetical protein IV203_010954 [Nitzschia inconspicua]